MAPYSRKYMKYNHLQKLLNQTLKRKYKRLKKIKGKDLAEAGMNVASSGFPMGSMVTAAMEGVKMARKVSTRGRKRVSTSSLQGKIYKGKKPNKRVKINGKYTQYGIAKNGVTLNYESRKTVVGSEAVAIGHTTMPGKVCAINIWRAVLKRLWTEGMKLYIKDYGSNMVGEGFVANDAFRVNYYLTGDATTTSSQSIAVDAASTFDSIAARFAGVFDDFPNLLNQVRWDSIEFLPQPTSRHGGSNLSLVGSKISVYTKSLLKVQNLTVESTADNEADDVNRVVLTGKRYQCKGNNFVMKSNKKLLPGLFNTYNEEALFDHWAIQNGAELGGTSVHYYEGAGTGNDTDTTFYKPAEPPKFWDIQNCQTVEKISVGPGGIKTSSLTQTYTFTLQYYMQLLYGMRSSANDTLLYNPKQGKTAVLYLEKVIGKTATEFNAITCWTELEFRQSVICHGSANKYTLPIQFQTNY